MARFVVYVLLLALAVAVFIAYQSRMAPPPPLPTPTPAPTAPPLMLTPLPTLDLRPVIRDYAARASVPLVSMVTNLDDVGRLLQSPALGDASWRNAVAAHLDAIRQAHADMNTIVPPSSLDPYHRQLTDGMRRCAQATDYLATGLDRLNPTDLEAARVLLTRCATEINEGRAAYDTHTAEIGVHAPLGQ